MTTPLDPRACAWLRRVARSPHRDALVLRGSVVTRHFCPERPTQDVDHLWIGPAAWDASGARAIVEDVLREPDAHAFGTPSFEIIWGETPFPGLRVAIDGLQIDVGWGDPLVAPPRELVVPDVGAPLAAVTAEVLYGWKVHGLFEFGHGQWRPKDLWDLWLLGRAAAGDDELLRRAIRVSFESRGTSFALTDRFRTPAWGASPSSLRRWKSFARKGTSGASVPALADVIRDVRARLVPLLPEADGLSTPASRS